MFNSHFMRLPFAVMLMCCAPAPGGESGQPGRSVDHDYEPPAPGTYSLPIVKAAADGEVIDSQNSALRLKELTRGRVTVMSFIYTRCTSAKACPMATGVLQQLHRLSADDAGLSKHLRLVSMSFDPANDTPERMAAYAALAAGRPTASEWRFITTASQAKLTPILEAYGQAVDRRKNPRDPAGPLNHTLRVFLIDSEGNIRNIYSSGTLDVRLVVADVKTLIQSAAQQSTDSSGSQRGGRPSPAADLVDADSEKSDKMRPSHPAR